MPQDFNTALLLLAVGMTTVFVILSLVVLSGRLLIRLVNSYAPDPISPRSKISPILADSPKELISPAIMASIIAAVEQITGGKGKVKNIEKK